jgi:hypothetical protein
MTIDEFAAKTGSIVSNYRWITYTVEHKGKSRMRVGNFMAERNATDADIIAAADKDIDAFYQKHMPDGCERPKVITFHKGALRLIMDDL